MAAGLIASHSLLTFPVQSLLASTQDQSTPTPVDVQVNRTTPAAGTPSEVPSFSSTPTVREISQSRLLPEALLPVGSPTSSDNVALAATLAQMPGQPSNVRLNLVARFMEAHPTSAWQASLLVNAGLLLLRDGFQTRAAVDFRGAWDLAKNDRTAFGIAVADRAIGQLLTMESRLGHAQALEKLLQDVGSRELTGKATEQLTAAKQALWVMQNAPAEAFRCGPYALAQMLNAIRPAAANTRVLTTKTGPRGMSLNALAQLAINNGYDVGSVRRESGTGFPIPAVIHLTSDHFAAVLRHEGHRYLVRDAMEPSGDSWILDTALAEEASGAALVPAGAIPDGWRAMTASEADQVWGRGYATQTPPPPGPPSPPTPPCPCGNGQGMATYQVHLLEVSLHLFDSPVGYTPPVGPAVQFGLDYNQRESTQPQTFLYSNLGQRWTFNWLSYVTDDPANPFATVALFRRGGGEDTYTINVQTGEYNQNTRDRLQLVRTSSTPVTYELRMPDGSKEVFAQSDGSSVYPRRVFMTRSYDPHGNAVTFTYDSQLRLIAATDAVGQVTTLSYALPLDIWKITSVTDPFGRTATLTYDSAGRLERITDVIQLWSKFTYAADGFITSLTTPYGTSRFTKSDSGINRLVEMTDPMGGKERVEYRANDDASFAQDAAGTVPSVPGVSFNNDFLQYRNTLYWDRKGMADAPGDRTKAHIYHWLHTKGNINQAVSILESEKKALENRVWYLYPNQAGSIWEGDGRQPSVTARVLDDGTTQAYQAQYNTLGQVTKRVDPLGRETVLEYDTNGIDLLRVKQKNGAGYDLLETRTYNAQHEPLTVTDAAGQPTTYTYNAQGQIATLTNAKNETTTYTYTANQLTSITGPVSGATTSFTYDAYGRVRTTTDADSYTVTTDYDAFDRPIRTTYPDGTFEQTQYRFLDVERRRDRKARWTTFTYDKMRRQTSVRDPLTRVVQQDWCTCGSLNALIDANGNRTSWDRDIQARVTKETRANGTFTTYVYETTTSRLKKLTDPKLQDTNYAYFADNQLQQTTYTNAQIATPSVSFTYDPVYGRLATMVDGTGTTTYGYYPVSTPPALGATRLASVDGPLTNDTITYEYDELGRVTTRAINGAANTVAWTFDALGRTSTEQNVLGTFTYTYDGVTGRIATVTYPNNQTSTYYYYGNSGDRRLQTIHHRYPSGNTLSKFDYTYDVVGSILTWRQQTDSTAVSWTYWYDTADQLTSAVKSSTDPTQLVLKRYTYSYDPSGNRTTEQIDDAVTGWSYDNMNRLVSEQPSGALRLEGTVSEPAAVTVAGKPLDVSATNRFTGSTPIVSGTTPFSITATDASGNSATKSYEIDSAGAGKTFTFDANGNLTADGTRTFDWDARNQLVAVNIGTHRSEFTYDGEQRRVRVVGKENNVVQSEMTAVWCNRSLCEERGSDGQTVSVRHFVLGEQVDGGGRFFTRDHLRSVRDVLDTGAALLARYSFDAWGRRAQEEGLASVGVGFSGHMWRDEDRLLFALYRVYDPDLGRWVNQDPSAWQGGLNMYVYADSDPVSKIDIYGLAARKCCSITARCRPLQFPVLGTMGFMHCDGEVVDRQERSHRLTAFNNGGRLDGGAYSPPPDTHTGRVIYNDPKASCDTVDCLIREAQSTFEDSNYDPLISNSNIWLRAVFRKCGIRLNITFFGPLY
jgi:RHS repeat-associated protein